MTPLKRRAPIVQERVLPASRERVFEAWSDPRGLALWMCPAPDMKGASVQLDFRVGGHFEIVMHGAEQDYRHRGEYLDLDPPNRLVMTWISEWLPDVEQRTRVEVTLSKVSEGQTRIVLVHDELTEGDSYAGHDEGWAAILAKLAQHLHPEKST